jgi:glycosyltransferase involved in cell wall biosynthesis
MKLFPSKSKLKEQQRNPNEKAIIDTGVSYFSDRIPFFSVCIPVYNRAKMLPAAIESVLCQSFDDFELIICDNASQDNIEELVASYNDSRIRYVRYATLVSMYANHNRCVDLARADWIIFLHSDDKLLLQALHTLKDLINTADPLTSVVVTQSTHIKTQLNLLKSSLGEKSDLSYPEALAFFMASGGISPSGTAYRKIINGDEIAYFKEGVITADHYYLVRQLQEKRIIRWANQQIVEKLKHINAASNVALYNVEWHYGYSVTYKKIVKHKSFQDFLPFLKKEFSDWPAEAQITLLTRLAQSANMSLVYELEKSTNKSNLSIKDFSSYFHIVLLKFDNLSYWKVLKLYKATKKFIFLLRQKYYNSIIKC